MVRAKLEPCEYIEEHSMHALFSQWSEKYSQGTLQEPMVADSNNDHAS